MQSFLGEYFIKAKIMTGSRKGDIAFIPRIDLAPSEAILQFTLKIRQYPVILSFAIPINKSQGQSFNNVGLYLPKPLFSHGQLYVTVSRVKYRQN